MTKSVYTLDKKHTVLIKFGVVEGKFQVDKSKSKQAKVVRMRIQWQLLLQITSQKCAKNVKRTTDMTLLLIAVNHSPSPFAILDALDCEFPLTHELRFL